MRAVVQRVLNAGVTVDGECVGRIGRGYLVLLGVGHGDTRAEADKLWGKLRGLRINEDEAETVRLMYYMLLNGKTTQEIADTLTDLGRETGLKKVCGKVNTVWSASSVATVMLLKWMLH